MQTFLPYPSFQTSAEVLDYRRVGKQRIEALQLLKMIVGEERSGWWHHPAREMWQDYPSALCEYGMVFCWEWIGRGYKDTTLERYNALAQSYRLFSEPYEYPWWLGNADFHSVQRANLVRKKPDFYKFDEDPLDGYI